MAPEYIARGRFSVKTDVYSYGIMVLEIICGRKNNSFQPSGVALHVSNLTSRSLTYKQLLFSF